MTGSRASDVFVRCLEAEGVRRVFGIPGEETLDLNHSLAHSSIEFVPVRQEQAGAFMAGMYGRLTGPRGRLPGHARAGRAEPRHRRRRRVPGPRPARRPHRAAAAGLDAQGVPPVRRPDRGHAADHEVERPRRPARDHPRGRAQGLSRGRDREARRDAPRALWELRDALDPGDMLISDVGLHKLWIARMFGAHEPNTVLIANGLAAMGFALPSAVSAKLAHPERRVVAVCGDGGVLMNFQELETATRLGTAFANPDFVGLAESFGMHAWRCDSATDFARHLRHALSLDAPSLIVLPIDYSIDVAISDELGEETVIRT